MTELKLQTLIDLGACQPQVDLVRARFGESVDITPELCESVASDFDFEWAAENLLTATAYVKCERVRDASYAEYEHVWDADFTEYLRVKIAAHVEYLRVIAREFARQYIAQGGAQ